MKIVITGAAGFIASHLAERLLGLGHTVVGIDSFTDYYDIGLKRLNAADVRQKGGQLLELDLAEDELSEAVDGADFIFHLAGQPGISATTPFETYLRNNVIASQRLLTAAQRVESLRCYVNIATSSVYGKQATEPETSVPKPTSHYGVTKLAAEQLALALQRDKGFPACSLRIFSVYGPRERPDKLYPILIRSLFEDKPLPLFEGSEHHRRSYTYVQDIVDGFVAVMRQPEVAVGEIFNIGSDVEHTTAEGIATVEKIMGKRVQIERRPRRSGDQLRTFANIEKASRLLGYEPQTRLEDGLREAVSWFEEKFYR